MMERAAEEILAGGESLLARVRAEADRKPIRMRFALGYLFLAGLAPVWEALDASGAEIHLLIGNTRSQPTDEQFAAAAAEGAGALARAEHDDVAAHARAERARIVAETAAALRANLASVGHTPEGARLTLGVARAIADNRLRVRIYPEGRLHAKAYLFLHAGGRENGDGIALVGSSNITLPAAGGSATELNVIVRSEPAIRAVGAWFDMLWATGQDFSRDLVAELSAAAWPASDPAFPAGS